MSRLAERERLSFKAAVAVVMAARNLDRAWAKHESGEVIVPLKHIGALHGALALFDTTLPTVKETRGILSCWGCWTTASDFTLVAGCPEHDPRTTGRTLSNQEGK